MSVAICTISLIPRAVWRGSLACGYLLAWGWYASWYGLCVEFVFPLFLNHCVSQLLDIVFITVEQILNGVSPEQHSVFFLLFWRFFVDLLITQWRADFGPERCINLFVYNCLPVNVFEPNVRFYLIWPVQSQTIRRFALKSFVDEICSFHAPACG